MGEPERLNGLLRENVVPVIGLRPPDMLQCALRGMGVVGDDRDVLLVFAGRFIRAHHQVLMFQSSDCDPPTRFRVSFQSSATTAVALSPTGFFALITKFSCLNAYCSQHCQRIFRSSSDPDDGTRAPGASWARIGPGFAMSSATRAASFPDIRVF